MMEINRIPLLGYAQQLAFTSGLSQSQRISRLTKTREALTDKYGSGAIDETFIPVARENYRYGLSALSFGALGKNAINGHLGGSLNIKA